MKRQSAEERDLRELLRRARVPAGAIDSYLRARERFRALPGVTGVDLGVKLRNGQTASRAGLTIRVHIARKKTKAKIPRAQRIPGRFEGIRTDVVEARYLAEHTAGHAARRARLDPLCPGACVSRTNGAAGTLGMFVQGRGADSASKYLLSADHVLADSGNPNVGDPIVQPAAEDGGTEVVAGLAARSKMHDAAIALVAQQARPCCNDVPDCADTIKGADFPFLGMIVHKFGIGTGTTAAEVVGFGDFDGVGAAMHLKPLASDIDDIPISDAGDSGAVWYDPTTGCAIGLHVRGSGSAAPKKEFAIATSIVKICDALRVRA